MIQYNIATLTKRQTESSVVEITDIHKACRTGDLSTIKHAYHLDPSRINTKDENLGWTPLFRTVIFGHIKASKFLLKHGANPNLVNSLGETPLHQAADNSQYIIAELLLDYKADPNKQQHDGDTPLHHAAFRGDSRMVEILLRHNADPNVANTLFGRTPLHFACDCGYEEAVLLMLQFKADPYLCDTQGKSPFEISGPQIQASIESFALLGTVVIHPSIEEEEEDEEEVQSSPELPVTALSRWLDNLGLGMYYQEFMEIGYGDLDTILNQMGSVFPVTLAELQKIGIQKLGHRYRILIKLEEDAGVFPAKSVVKNQWQCCNVARKTQFGFTTTSLETWLGVLKLGELVEVFEKAGFDEYGFIITQMKSRYPINEEILNEIGIHKPGHRNRIIGSLIDDCKEKNGIVVESAQTKVSCEMCLVF